MSWKDIRRGDHVGSYNASMTSEHFCDRGRSCFFTDRPDDSSTDSTMSERTLIRAGA